MARRLTMGLLCCSTAGFAALGISSQPRNVDRTSAPATGAIGTNARADTAQPANRSQTRTVPAKPSAPKPTPVKPTPAKPTGAKLTSVKPTPAKPAPLPGIRGLNSSQVHYAYAIVAEGRRMDVSRRGRIIAIATALQESNLKNYRHAVDHDSLGLFQQRPSTGWGTPQQLTNPSYAAHAFYAALLRYKGSWGCLTCAAQLVQRSAFPNAYAQHEAFATTIVDILDKRF